MQAFVVVGAVVDATVVASQPPGPVFASEPDALDVPAPHERAHDLCDHPCAVERIVDDAIAENGATSLRDLGRVMADVMPQVAGRADGSAVSQLVREKLA